MSSKIGCPNCGGTETRESDEHYEVVCAGCGLVVDEKFLVEDVGIGIASDGRAYQMGVRVDETGPRFGRVPGVSRDSRQVTLDKARGNITRLAGDLKIPSSSNIIDLTLETYKLALITGFVKGRPSEHVTAACLYVILRQEQTHHMLLDFADVLRTNVYVLGHAFLRLCQCLNIHLPVIDPSLYIPRFAMMLEFEDKTQQVIKTAERLVQRMSRDWMQTGRRPAGICGAALLVAAKLHGFHRSTKDVIRVVRICEVTLKRRLSEFENTAVCDLTPAEFEAIDFEDLEACDPPAFTRLRLKEKEEQEMLEKLKAEQGDQGDDILEQEMNEVTGELNSVAGKVSLKRKREGEQHRARKRIRLNENGEDTLSDIDDDEIDVHLCSSKEVELRREIWNETHSEYLKEQEEKKQLEEARNMHTQKARRTPQRSKPAAEPRTAAEACKGVLSRANARLLQKILPEQPKYERVREVAELKTTFKTSDEGEEEDQMAFEEKLRKKRLKLLSSDLGMDDEEEEDSDDDE